MGHLPCFDNEKRRLLVAYQVYIESSIADILGTNEKAPEALRIPDLLFT